MFNLTTKNTTVLGIAMIITALSSAAAAVFDGELTTEVDFASLIAALSGGVALMRVKVEPVPPTA